MSGVQVHRHCAAAWASTRQDEPDHPVLDPVGLLQLIDALEPARPASHESEHEPDSDLARVERKLDTLLQLVSLLGAADSRQPTRVPLQLSPADIQWSASDLSDPRRDDDQLLIWLNPLSPVPLRLSGLFMNEGPDTRRFQLSFNDSDFESAWARLLFRWHRREIARSR